MFHLSTKWQNKFFFLLFFFRVKFMQKPRKKFVINEGKLFMFPFFWSIEYEGKDHATKKGAVINTIKILWIPTDSFISQFKEGNNFFRRVHYGYNKFKGKFILVQQIFLSFASFHDKQITTFIPKSLIRDV